MNKDEIKIQISVGGADKAKSDIAGVQHQCNTSTGSIAKGVFAANLAFEALKQTIGLVTDIAQKAASVTVDFIKDSVSAFEDYRKAMTTLEIIAPKFGVSIEKAQEAAKMLGKELRIGVGPAAESLQNLLKSGLNLEQATDLMRRFTNEAITGKSKELDLTTAVQNLSFAYMTQNSMLGNMSGISENYNDIIARGAKLMGMQTKDMNETQLAQAKYKGMIELTNLTLGSSEKLMKGYSFQVQDMKIAWQEFQVEIGSQIEPILGQLMGWFNQTGILEKFKDGIRKITNAALAMFSILRGEEGGREALLNLGLSEKEADKIIAYRDRIVELFKSIWTKIQPNIDNLKQSLSELWEAVTEAFFGFIDALTGREDIWEEYEEAGTTGIGGVIDVITLCIDKVKELVVWFDENKERIIDNVKMGVQIGTVIVKGLIEVVKIVVKVVGWFMKVYATLQLWMTYARDAWNATKQFFSDLIEWAKRTWESIKEGAKNLWESLKIGVKTFVEEAIVFIKNLPTTLLESIGMMIGYIQLFFTQEAPRIIGEFIAKIVEWFKELPGKIGEVMSNIAQRIVEWKDRSKENVKSFIDSAIQWFKDLPSKIAEAWENLKTKALETINNIINGFRGGVNTIVQFFKDMPGKIKDAFNILISKVESAINHIIDGYNKVPGIKDMGHVVIPRIAHQGGIVPVGENVPIIARGGEMVLTERMQYGILQLLKQLGTGKSVNFNAPVNIGGNRSPEQGIDLFSSYLLKAV